MTLPDEIYINDECPYWYRGPYWNRDGEPAVKYVREKPEQILKIKSLLDEIMFHCDGEIDITEHGSPNLAMRCDSAAEEIYRLLDTLTPKHAEEENKG